MLSIIEARLVKFPESEKSLHFTLYPLLSIWFILLVTSWTLNMHFGKKALIWNNKDPNMLHVKSEIERKLPHRFKRTLNSRAFFPPLSFLAYFKRIQRYAYYS